MPNLSRENSNESGYNATHYSHYWNGRFRVIYYDRRFIAIELISICIVLITIIAVYIFTYKPLINDPIASEKNTFLTFQLICIGITIVSTGLVTFLSKTKETLIRSLRLIVVLSCLTIIMHLGIELYMNKTYNKETFEEFYETYEQSKKQNDSQIAIGLTGIKILGAKEFYIEESMKAYNNFKVKAIIYMVIHVMIALIIFYLASRLSSKESKKQKVYKNDTVLFDEEENIKF